MLSTDPGVLIEGTSVRSRMLAYADLFDELTIVLLGTGAAVHETPRPNLRILKPGGSTKVVSALRALYVVWTSQADVVSAQDPLWTGLIAVWSGKRRIQIQVHTDELGLVGRVLAPYTLRRATAVRVVSEKIAHWARARTPAPVSVLPIYVDATRLRAQLPEPRAYGSEPRLLTVSRLTPEKRVSRVIDALVWVPRAHLYIVGDGPLRASLERRAARRGLSERVHFLGWQNDVRGFYQYADCFVHASAFEGYGMALLEAALAGCPIVSTHVGLVGELPPESVTIVRGTEYELAAAINATLTSEKKSAARAASAALAARLPSFTEYLAEYKRLVESV